MAATTEGEQAIVGLDPSDSIVFTVVEKTSPKSVLTISNPSEFQHVTFKVKTTRPLRYLVRPNQGVIGPKGTATVSVILQTKDCDEIVHMDSSERQKTNDKFLVQSAPVDDEFCNSIVDKSTKEITELLTQKWNTFDKKDIINKKLRCAFTVGQVRDQTHI